MEVKKERDNPSLDSEGFCLSEDCRNNKEAFREEKNPMVRG